MIEIIWEIVKEVAAEIIAKSVSIKALLRWVWAHKQIAWLPYILVMLIKKTEVEQWLDPCKHYYSSAIIIFFAVGLVSLMWIGYGILLLRRERLLSKNKVEKHIELPAAVCIFALIIANLRLGIFWKSLQGVDVVKVIVTKDVEEPPQNAALRHFFDKYMREVQDKMEQSHVELKWGTKDMGLFPRETGESMLERMRRNLGYFAVVWVQYYEEEGKIVAVIPERAERDDIKQRLSKEGIFLGQLDEDWELPSPFTPKDLVKRIANLTFLYWGLLRYGQGQGEEVLESFQSLCTLNERDEKELYDVLDHEPYYLYVLLNSCYRQGDLDLPKVKLKQEKEGREIKRTVEELGIGKIQELGGSLDLTIDAYRKLLLEKACYHRGDLLSAEDHGRRFERIVEAKDEDILKDPRAIGEAYHYLGKIKHGQGELDEAVGFYEKADGMIPAVDLYDDWGSALLEQGKVNEAREKLNRVTEAERETGVMVPQRVYVTKVPTITVRALVFGDVGKGVEYRVELLGREEDDREVLASSLLEEEINGFYHATLDVESILKNIPFSYDPERAKLEIAEEYRLDFYQVGQEPLLRSIDIVISLTPFISVRLLSPAEARDRITLGDDIPVEARIIVEYEGPERICTHPSILDDIAGYVQVELPPPYFPLTESAPLTKGIDGSFYEKDFKPHRYIQGDYVLKVTIKDEKSEELVIESDPYEFSVVMPTPEPTPTPG